MADGKGFIRPTGPPLITTLFGKPQTISPAPGGIQEYSGSNVDPGMMAPTPSSISEIDVAPLMKILRQREEQSRKKR